MSTKHLGIVALSFLFALVCARASSAESSLDTPISIERSGSVPSAISDVYASLDEDSREYFGSAVNALREEITFATTSVLSRADAREREVALLDGMTPRQVILAGLLLYRRQRHSVEDKNFRYSDAAIEEALASFSKKKANQPPQPTPLKRRD